MTHVMNTYARQPVGFVRGAGAWLWDEAGNEYLDAVAGVAVNTLGHGHPRLVQALSKQLAEVIHTSNHYRIPLQEQVADRLCELSGLDEAFFCNSGLEANEAAIKIARKYGHARGKAKPTILVMDNAFHGRSLATLSATANPKAHEGFGPLVEGFVRVPLNDLDAVRRIADQNDDVVAVLLEPIQGEGGVHVSRLEYLRGLAELCDEREWLFISDEVQCGIGRTGKWFMYQHAGIRPDVLPLAKGLGSGVPVGACLAGGRARGVFQPGSHGSTFGGNPLAMRAVLTTLDTMVDENLLENALVVGTYLQERLSRELASVPGVVEVRGRGLMIGVQLDRPCREVALACLERGLLVNVTAECVVRLIPPLILTKDEAGQVVERLVPVLRAFLA